MTVLLYDQASYVFTLSLQLPSYARAEGGIGFVHGPRFPSYTDTQIHAKAPPLLGTTSL
jgi:hypothetical protein